jgi:hypothetical protein
LILLSLETRNLRGAFFGDVDRCRMPNPSLIRPTHSIALGHAPLRINGALLKSCDEQQTSRVDFWIGLLGTIIGASGPVPAFASGLSQRCPAALRAVSSEPKQKTGIPA